ncbi:2-hydroxymuconate tautomerase [Lactobacillus sp. PV012]|uniref:2-hydroxymuconate tautomerase n=1 Tax=Lactobacillus sp. PV012 TaxID=2594494 RepID=UPI00224094C5|nr:2-hydroxymuconate tautomerase [Lactobacillus sp. PV012]QNQ82068.1 4-oxalocrotonate tautomerase [Lactobacillus sp. PV012]
MHYNKDIKIKKKKEIIMPFVHVELIKGRSDEQLTNLMKDITEAVHKNTGAPKEHIHVIINELDKHTYGQGGKWRA